MFGVLQDNINICTGRCGSRGIYIYINVITY